MNATKKQGGHTPLPWALADHDWHTIVGPATRFNAERGGLAAIAVVDASDNVDEDLANADIIVRAVNCHDDLLTALQQIYLAPLSHGDDAVNEMQRVASAAIAKATACFSFGSPGERIEA